MERDLTTGSVTKQLVRFCLPFLLSNFLQAMYNVMDTWVVAWFAGANTVSGVANGGQITLIVMNFAIGFTIGGTVLVSQFFGAGERGELKKTIGTMFAVLSMIAVIVTALVIIFAKPILRLINTPAEAFNEAYLYLVICMSGSIFTFGYNAVAAILRGMGDSKNPLYFVLIAGIVNTLLDLPFVGLFHWGAAGDAVSTIIAQALSLFLAIRYLKKKQFVFEFKLKNFKIDRQKFRQILKIGFPSSINNTVVGLSFLMMMMMVNGFGVNASAAMGIAGKFNGLAILPAIAMSSSVSSMAAQNIGAGKFDRARKTMYTGMVLALPIGILFFLIAFFAPVPLFHIFTDDAPVIAEGIRYIRWFSLDYIVVAFLFCLNGLFIASGMTTVTMLNGMLSSVIIRIPVAYIFGITMQMGLLGIGLAAPVASMASLIIAALIYRTGSWKQKRIIGNAPMIEIEDLV